MTVAPDLVLFGNLLVDDIVLADGQTLLGEPGGAVLHTALAASLWGSRVGIVSVAGTDYPASAFKLLADRGVDLTGVRRLERPGGRAWLLHEPQARRVIHHLDCPTHHEVSPVVVDLPAAWRTARGIHLAPMPLDRQAELVSGLAATAPASFVSLDPFELIRDESLDRWREPLTGIDALFAGVDDIRLSTDPAPTLAARAGDRLRFLVLKRAEQGGLLLDLLDGGEHRWAARAEGVVDVTGAGDAFAGGFLAGLLAGGGIDACLAQGVVSASFAVADWGCRGLASTTPAEARGRLAAWFPEIGPRARLEHATR
jgi:sugar/nucleoside kinase (ribokinase family)